METATRALAAIVFTDIVGYSAVVHRDEALGARLLDRQRAVVRRLLPQYRGREVETAGDSFLLEFGSALAAIEAVIAIQQALASDPAQPAVVLRASVHLGDVEHRGREVYGDGVNVAARLLPHSPEGGLALSAAVNAVIRQRMNLPLRSIGEPPLKNIGTPVEILVLDAVELRALPEAAPSQAGPAADRTRRLRGPHGLLLAGLAQALAASFDLFVGFGLIVILLHAVDPRHPEAHVSVLYFGVAAIAVGTVLLGSCYGLLRTRGWGRSISLLFNTLNIPLAIALQTTLSNFAFAQGEQHPFPVWFWLLGPTLSLVVAAFLLNPRVSARFADR
jgi:class 3 adenylate cyclase